MVAGTDTVTTGKARFYREKPRRGTLSTRWRGRAGARRRGAWSHGWPRHRGVRRPPRSSRRYRCSCSFGTEVLSRVTSGHPGGAYTLRVHRNKEGLHLTCQDRGGLRTGNTHLVPVPRGLDPGAESGRGLVLVDALATEWGDNGNAQYRTVWLFLAYDLAENPWNTIRPRRYKPVTGTCSSGSVRPLNPSESPALPAWRRPMTWTRCC